MVIVLLLELDELLHQTLGDSLITLLSVEIVQLFRVGVQVVEFPLVDVVVEVDEFPSVGSADTIVALHAVLRGVFVIVVVKALTPVFRVLSLQERQKRLALYVVGNRCTGKFEEGWRIVDVLHHFLDVALGVEALRKGA